MRIRHVEELLVLHVEGLLSPPLSATSHSLLRIATHGEEDEIPPPWEPVV